MIAEIDSVKVTTNLWGERWSKLCVNGMRNGVSAATGLPGNALDRDEAVRRFCIRLGGEAVRVGQALGYQLEHIGKLEPELLARAMEGDAKSLDEAEAIMIAGVQFGDAQRSAAAPRWAGYAEGAAHRDRLHERVHRGQGGRDRPGGGGARGADRHREARVAG